MALWKDFANTASVNPGTYYALIPSVVELTPQEYVIAFYRVNLTFTKTSNTWNISIPSGTVIGLQFKPSGNSGLTENWIEPAVWGGSI